MSTSGAFSAHPATTLDYDSGSIVQFDVIVTNIENSYYSNLSVFQCPSDGIYLFAISLQSIEEIAMSAELVKDGSVLLRSWSDYDNNFQSAMQRLTLT